MPPCWLPCASGWERSGSGGLVGGSTGYPVVFQMTERIRGELLKLGIEVSERTIQKYMRGVRGRRGGGQSWATFVKNQADRMLACEFIQTQISCFAP